MSGPYVAWDDTSSEEDVPHEVEQQLADAVARRSMPLRRRHRASKGAHHLRLQPAFFEACGQAALRRQPLAFQRGISTRRLSAKPGPQPNAGAVWQITKLTKSELRAQTDYLSITKAFKKDTAKQIMERA